MEHYTWIDYVTAIGSISTPILVLFLTGLGWKIRARLERTAELEDRLREDRIAIYNDILEPFFILLMPEAIWLSNPKNKNTKKDEVATTKMLSIEYRKQALKLSLIGSDAVVKSYNNLLQYFYMKDEASQKSEVDINEIKHMIGLLGTLLLEIRRSMGNESTKLNNWDMLEWFINDARKI